MENYRPRLLAFAALVLLFFVLVTGRLVQLQWVDGKKYQVFSQASTLRETNIPAPRGRILDRNGKILAENRPSFVLTLNLAQVAEMERSLNTLAFLLEWPLDRVREKLSTKKLLPKFIPLTVARDLSREEVAKIRSKLGRLTHEPREELDLSGIELNIRYERIYPSHEKIGHVLGYVREVNESQLKDWQGREPGRVGPGDKVGIVGVEKYFDDRLRGYDGHRQAFVDAMGREVDLSQLGLKELLKFKKAIPGRDVRLTLDSRLMEAAYEAFGSQVGALVAVDPRNGEILAMVSAPSYDPEVMSGSLSPELWKSLQEHPAKILLNRSLQSAYPPGSTYKVVTALAAYAEGKTNFSEKISCPGFYLFGGRKWGCWNKRGHGPMDLVHALIHSCDVYFYRMGERLGPEKLERYARLLGLGMRSGILGDDEREGLIPTQDWKQKTKGENWAPADNLGIAIGQGYDLVTPMQNALMIAQFANGGRKIVPHLLKENIETENTESTENTASMENTQEQLPWGITEDDFRKIRHALIEVVNGGGTGGRAKIDGLKVGGKTGTAQVIGHDYQGPRPPGVKTGDHAWFVAFAPEDPKIAVAVIVEHGGHGGTAAAPIAKRVIEEYFKWHPLPEN